MARLSPLCPDSVTGTHAADRDGHCSWCGRRVAAPVPAPARYPQAEDMMWWRYYHDPDFGVDDE